VRGGGGRGRVRTLIVSSFAVRRGKTQLAHLVDLCLGRELTPQHHLSLLCELDCIHQQVDQGLAQPSHVSNHVVGEERVDVQHQLESFGMGHWGH